MIDDTAPFFPRKKLSLSVLHDLTVNMLIQEPKKAVHSVRRSGALSFKSQLLRDLETIVLFPFYVGGYKRQAQTLLIDLGRFTPPSDSLMAVNWHSHPSVLQFYSSQMISILGNEAIIKSVFNSINEQLHKFG